MNNKKTKRVTIADLAKMIKEDVVDRMATKEDLNAQQETLNKMNKTLTTHGQVIQVMLKEITTIHKNTKSFRENISTLYTDHLAYDRKIDNVIVRVEKLELKSK